VALYASKKSGRNRVTSAEIERTRSTLSPTF
jgi:hypothetical protein